MQQLIEYLDPIHSAIKDKATELLEVEKEQMKTIFLEGRDYAANRIKEELNNNYIYFDKKLIK